MAKKKRSYKRTVRKTKSSFISRLFNSAWKSITNTSKWNAKGKYWYKL